MSGNDEQSLDDEATFAGARGRIASEVSLGDDRTLGDGASGQDTRLDDLEIVDLEARYRIEGTLGQGGMGAVVLATDTRLDRKVAIKRILGEAAGNRVAVARFLTEAKAIAALNHPNIVQIYDSGRAKDGPFLIMEYVDGGSLLDRCLVGALPLDEAIDLACHLCDGLARAHDAGIVHRDIKPANVLLTKDGTPKLADFGLAKAESGDHGQTRTGAVLGTPDYMSPEQRRGASEVDARSDLWSLAATVYHMVTGRSPKVIRLSDLPSALQDVLAKALEEKKEARYQATGDLREALRIAIRAAETTVSPLPGANRIQDGWCATCGFINKDPGRKFCRNPECGASLRIECLDCDGQMPVWEAICGECGCSQPKRLDEMRAWLSEKRATAEERLRALDFGEAELLAVDLAETKQRQFADFSEWGRSFIATIAEERGRHEDALVEKMAEARTHCAAFDYRAAIHTLEAIPEKLRTTAIDAEIAAIRLRQEELSDLVGTIASRLQRKEIDGLLPLVERAVKLHGNRSDLQTILRQLTERRDSRVARAKAAERAGDMKQAALFLGGLSDEDFGQHRPMITRVRQAAELEDRIATAVREARSDGEVTLCEAGTILALGEKYLSLNPGSERIKRLVGKCREIVEPPFLHNSIGITMKRFSRSEFQAVVVDAGAEETSSKVIIGGYLYLSVSPVTFAQWEKVMGVHQSVLRAKSDPVDRIRWEEAMSFCCELSAVPEEQSMGRTYRLPTESEWEYASRLLASPSGVDPVGDGDSMLRGRVKRFATPVAQAKNVPIEETWDLVDFWEWCSESDGMRGVDEWRDGRLRTARNCWSAERRQLASSYCDYQLGFRVVMIPASSPVSVPDVVRADET
jgi:formylglycine-generating enzyme required for sulfatase activity